MGTEGQVGLWKGNREWAVWDEERGWCPGLGMCGEREGCWGWGKGTGMGQGHSGKRDK